MVPLKKREQIGQPFGQKEKKISQPSALLKKKQIGQPIKTNLKIDRKRFQ